jgi:hypothetical protein
MKLSKRSVSALHFALAPAALAVILLFSSSTFAQHSGGSAASGGSSGGGGGSHGGSSGGSASSGGGHSSGGGSSAHSSAGHSSSAGSISSHSGTSHSNASHSNAAHSNIAHSNAAHLTQAGSKGAPGISRKRGFFSFLRHHVPKPEPKPEPPPKPMEQAKVRPPLCFRGPCPVCPAGHFHGGSGCEGTDLRDRVRRLCPAGEYWGAGVCLQQTWYQDECGGLRTMMERQAKRMREAEQDRQISCVLGPRQQCEDFTSSAGSEADFYQVLQNRYQACQRRLPTGPRYNGFRVPGYSAGVSFNSLRLGLGAR